MICFFNVHGDLICTLDFHLALGWNSYRKDYRELSTFTIDYITSFRLFYSFSFLLFFSTRFLWVFCIFLFSFLAWRFACNLWNITYTQNHTHQKISAPGYNTAYNAYNSYNPVSRRDSELASLSSGRTDSDTMSISSMSTTWVMSFLFFHFSKFKGSGFRRLDLLLLMFMLYKLGGRINIKLILSFNYQFLFRISTEMAALKEGHTIMDKGILNERWCVIMQLPITISVH